MSNHESHEDIRKHLKVYVAVFIALLMGTIFTVAASYIPRGTLPFGMAGVVGLALTIAVIKAFLVAGYFMHLVTEKTVIYTIMGFTAFFFTGLMALTIWAMHDGITLH